MISTEHGIQKNMKYRILFILFFLAVFVLLFRLSVYSETPSPEAEATETPSEAEIISPLPSETEEPTEAPITSEPTEPASPTAEPETPTPSTQAPTPTPTLPPTPSPTEPATPTAVITAVPTATPELHFLYDFTPPPLNQNHVSDKTLAPDVTPNPTMSAASIGIVRIDNIDNTKQGFYWSDLIQYAAYCFYVLAGAAVLYGIACLIGLLCFKKDLSIGAIRKRRRKRRKDTVK